MGLVECGGCGVWGLQCVGVALCGGCILYIFLGAHKFNFYPKPEILNFHFCVFAILTLEFCYYQSGDPGTLRIVLKDAYLY